jgi:hypothetical protein
MIDDVVLVVKDPEKAARKEGSLTIKMHIKFEVDEEARRFNEWLNSSTFRLQIVKKPIRNLLWAAFAGFMLHDWFGDKK